MQYPYLNNFKNIHAGQTCLIVGNGPSLREVPSKFLFKYDTFGSNRCYIRFMPDYYVCVNPLVISQNRADIEALDCLKFIRDGACGGYPLHGVGRKAFSFEPDKWIYEGYTVTFVALQLAYWMGYTTALLVGVDHRYRYDGKPNEKHLLLGGDPNHFDPNYFSGQEWNNPDLERSAQAYQLAKSAYETQGRRILNLTAGTALDVFEKGSIEEWM